MKSTMNPGRLAGLLYVVASVFGVFALLYVPNKLLVDGDAAATAHNIAASASLFRLGIAAELIGQAIFVFVALALYHLLKDVNPRHALAMLTLILIAIPIAFFNEVNSVAALTLAHGPEFLTVFAQPQRDALTRLFLDLRGAGFDVAEIFWGLWLFPLGWLVYRSGFIPRVLGVLLILNGFTYPIDSLASLLAPHLERALHRWTTPFQFGELIFMFWLLIMGATPETELAVPPPSTGRLEQPDQA
jgi:hypothetical protein